jgi:FtsH-binding integral membrane protein
MTVSHEKKSVEQRPSLSVLALISFALSFAVARLFTFLSPRIALRPSGFHIHHFWFGILMLAIGGWLGISYNDRRIDQVAAIIFGAGGGLIGDEVGILLTFRGEYYWAGISYTFIIILLAFAFILVLLNRYSKVIAKEFTEFSRSRAGLYSAIFLLAISLAFLIDTENPVVVAVTSILVTIACVILLFFSVKAIRDRLHKNVVSR